MNYFGKISLGSLLCYLTAGMAQAQKISIKPDSTVISNAYVRLTVHTYSGYIDYQFSNGVRLQHTVATIDETKAGRLSSTDFSQHQCNTTPVQDANGRGLLLHVTHRDPAKALQLEQQITIYEKAAHLLLKVQATGNTTLETRNISPLTILPGQQHYLSVPGSSSRILDVPFDNDNWVPVVTRQWPSVSGISYEFTSIYDQQTLSGLVAGSVTHDFWKTGLRYGAGKENGRIDSFIIYGGAATPDDRNLPPAYGGLDGTHDHFPHGAMQGPTVSSPLIFLSATADTRQAFSAYGKVNVQMAGKSEWKGNAPFYWNSFGVENVLGYTKIMMPPDVLKTSDFIASMTNFNKYAPPVLSIDSYDQSIYTTEVLAAIGEHGRKNRQQMGFYFIPFAVWTWKNTVETQQLSGTQTPLSEVVLRDGNHQPIMYKEGDWAAYAIDPSHPATRQSVIQQLLKAKAIHATFIKIDFLTAGALESSTRYNKNIRSGMQAYSEGMKMLRSLVDSIMGPDIFLTMAISPMFPHQYAHTRFVSTDVYSHLRDDQPGFPHYGSTAASLAAGSHMWWMQGTLWPFTNLDVVVMKNFQQNPDLSEQEIKVRLYAMMVMGSILGDGSDLRQPVAAERFRKFLDHPALCAWFSHPAAFTPVRMSEGDTQDQQLTFSYKGDTTLLAAFNFVQDKTFESSWQTATVLKDKREYEIRDFLSNALLGEIRKGQTSFTLSVPAKDALLVKLVPRN